jgi:hypothetical protein
MLWREQLQQIREWVRLHMRIAEQRFRRGMAPQGLTRTMGFPISSRQVAMTTHDSTNLVIITFPPAGNEADRVAVYPVTPSAPASVH